MCDETFEQLYFIIKKVLLHLKSDNNCNSYVLHQSSAHFLYEGAYFTHTNTDTTQTHTRKQNAKVHCEIERAIVIGTWGHTSDKVNKEKCTQLEPSNLFVETFEEKKQNKRKYKTALVKQKKKSNKNSKILSVLSFIQQTS